MKKRVCFFLAFLLVLSLIGCSVPGQEADTDSTPDASPVESPSEAQPAETPAAEAESAAEEVTYDVVVVGSGASGMCAGIAAGQSGAKTLIIEQLSYFGGSSNGAEAVAGFNSSVQKGFGMDEIPLGPTFNNMMEYSHWNSEPELSRLVLEESGDAISWLADMGVQFSDIYTATKAINVTHMFTGMFTAALDVLYQRAADAGVDMLAETRGYQLLTNDGTVCGLLAEKVDGSTLKINADAVIMCTGGFGDNEEMIEQYTAYDFDHLSPCSTTPGHNGDGINMGISAGAAITGMSTVEFSGGILAGRPMTSATSLTAGRQPTLWVNQDAERFYPESNAGEWSLSGNALVRQEAAYAIFDSAYIDRLINEGCINGKGAYFRNGTPLTNLMTEIDDELAAGKDDVFKADTLEDLAGQIGLDVTHFMETVDRYNGYAATGYDEEFFVESDYYFNISEGPFYAFKIANGYYCTLGGLKVNDSLEVKSTEGDIIPGLYAAGVDAGGIFGDSYDVGIVAAGTMSWNIVSGRTAGTSAAAYALGN